MMGHPFLERLSRTDVVTRCGRVTRILPTFVEADGPNAPLGALCQIETRAGQDARGPIQVMAEVVGVKGASIVLAPFDDRVPTFAGARVEACPEADGVGVGDGYLGRAIDGLGRPIDNLPSVRADQRRPWEGSPTPPLERTATRRVLRTGVRAIDGLLTLAEGQRVGVFAASGVGKTSLIMQMAQQIEADRCVICLVGERGREVEALWSEGLSPQARARTVLVAATSDQSAATRVRAGGQALALAEHWRDQGRHVLLILDSVTRLAMALRETGLAAGEPPTVRAYTPGVFAALPKIVERCGALKSGGAITALFTVLSETDEVDDPVCEMMKSLLDGHIILARRLAEQGHYPAIDVPRSISRLAGELNDRAHRTNVNTAVAQLSAFEASRTLIEAGVYVPGANRELDEALDRRPALLSFLRQGQ
ncbi:MAG: FliI/YscN family ATPase, partial [Caulobacteraceae bacterium]|nr:FliI/YscN family ATPase [Caulobacteraceae bacterium]